MWDMSLTRPYSPNPLVESLRTRILIIGSGITGSFLAERLSRLTSSIVIIDRHRPQSASTAASTSLLQWEIDTPLSELSTRLGQSDAVRIYRTSARAVRDIVALVAELGIECHCAPRPSLYISGSQLGPVELREEQRQREAAGLPTTYLSAGDLRTAFGFVSAAALYSEGAAEANPVDLAEGLMAAALQRGARLHHPETAVGYDLGPRNATVLTESGREIEADILILANGYEMPNFVPSKIHRITSTWALATSIGARLWPRHALLWEASQPYLYARPNSEGRIIIGGEDEDLTDADRRDLKIIDKARIIQRKFGRIYPALQAPAEFSWAGFFGATRDSLPLIGALPRHRHVFTAFGYGGNGITFSFIAARLIADAIAGNGSRLTEHFAVDRD